MERTGLVRTTGDDVFIDELKRIEREILQEVDPSALEVIDEIEQTEEDDAE